MLLRNVSWETYERLMEEREDLSRSFEPDECFYFTNIEAVRGKRDVNLSAGEPPPDLVFEADVTNPSRNELPIYAWLGVAEVWRYDGGRLEILSRNSAGDGYEAVAGSAFLPSLTSTELTRFVQEGLATRRPTPNEGYAIGRGATVTRVPRRAVSESRAAIDPLPRVQGRGLLFVSFSLALILPLRRSGRPGLPRPPLRPRRWRVW